MKKPYYNLTYRKLIYHNTLYGYSLMLDLKWLIFKRELFKEYKRKLLNLYLYLLTKGSHRHRMFVVRLFKDDTDYRVKRAIIRTKWNK